MDLMQLVQSQLSEGLIDQLSNQIGGAPRQQTEVATNGIVSALVNAMAKQAQQGGAQNITNALQRDHDGSLFENIGGFLQGNIQPEQRRAANGMGILNHLLGNKQGGMANMISKMSGLDQNSAGSLMTMLAPIVMGALGKQRRQNNLDANGIMDLLQNNAQQQRQQATANPAMGLISQFLDQDGDGDIKDDLAGMGMKFLGNMFRGQ